MLVKLCIHFDCDNHWCILESQPTLQAPDRVYKVVFVGNGGVGKTSFIQRFVSETFREGISATIGVDYQVSRLMTSQLG